MTVAAAKQPAVEPVLQRDVIRPRFDIGPSLLYVMSFFIIITRRRQKHRRPQHPHQVAGGHVYRTRRLGKWYHIRVAVTVSTSIVKRSIEWRGIQESIVVVEIVF